MTVFLKRNTWLSLVPGGIPDEQISGFNTEGVGQPLDHVQGETPALAVLQVVDRGLAGAHEVRESLLAQAAFRPELLDREGQGGHGWEYTIRADILPNAGSRITVWMTPDHVREVGR